MQINHIRVQGFRNIKDISIHFNSITALVGLNGYGKSNIIDAFSFGIEFIHSVGQQKLSMMSAKNIIPLLISNAQSNYVFGINLSINVNGESYTVDYEYSFAWATDATPAKIVNEILKIKCDNRGQKYSTYIMRDEFSAKFKASNTGRCNKKISIDNYTLVINKLLALDDLFYKNIVQQINSVQFFIERHLDASPSYEPSPIVIKGFQELELQGIQSIPRAIFFLKKDHEDKYQQLLNAFQQLFPNITDLIVSEIKLNDELLKSGAQIGDSPFVFTDSIYSISIIDNRLIQPINFNSLSDGTKRIFLMLTFAVIADIKDLSLLAIEEPENSIHPSLFQYYLDILEQLVNGCRIIITSHSPYIIQYLPPECLYIGLANPNGEAQFRRIAASKRHKLVNDAAEYNYSLGDYIFSLISSEDADSAIGDYVENYK